MLTLNLYYIELYIKREPAVVPAAQSRQRSMATLTLRNDKGQRRQRLDASVAVRVAPGKERLTKWWRDIR